MVPRVTGNPRKNTTKEKFLRNIVSEKGQYDYNCLRKKPSTAEWQLCISQKVSQATAQEALKEPWTTFNLYKGYKRTNSKWSN